MKNLVTDLKCNRHNAKNRQCFYPCSCICCILVCVLFLRHPLCRKKCTWA